MLREPAYRRKFRVERIVERLIKAEHDDEDLYGEILGKPLGQLVALICKDLGLNPDWASLAEQAWAKAEMESGVAGSPFAILNAARAPPLAGEGDPEGVEGACAPTTFRSKTPDG